MSHAKHCSAGRCCTVCGQPALPGFKPAQGKCRWHWVASVWGRAWALQSVGPEPR